MTLDPVLARIDENLDAATARLLDLLRIPSISTDPAYKADCDRAADWLVEDLKSIGFEASKRPTPGHPMVVAHSDGDGPHILFYGHYDVQGVDNPRAAWDVDPFAAVVRDGYLIARGASDNKGPGPLVTALSRQAGTLPVPITIVPEDLSKERLEAIT